MSSIIGGRSGNRGKCAQPCRLPYELLAKESAKGNGVEQENGFRPCGKGYLLSPKDMCTVEELERIISAGVRSLKIEGRMKSPEYVATVVRTYRKYLDMAHSSLGEGNLTRKPVEARDLTNLAQIFNRGGFTTGYFLGKTGRDMMSYEKPKNWGIYLGEVISHDRAAKTVRIKLDEELSIGDGIEIWNREEGESPGNVVTLLKVGNRNADSAGKGDIVTVGSIDGRIYKGNKVYRTSSKRLIDEAKETYARPGNRQTALWGKIDIRAGKPVRLEIEDGERNRVEVQGKILPEAAIKRPLTEERVREQLGKTGGTPFMFERMDVDLEPGLSLPVSEINETRRKALDELMEKKICMYKRKVPDNFGGSKEKLLNFPGKDRKVEKNPRVSVLFYDIDEKTDYSELVADRVYLPFRGLLEGKINITAINDIKESGKEVFLWLPSITRGNYDRLAKARMDELKTLGLDGMLVGNPGTLKLLESSSGFYLEGDHTFNTFNSYALKELHRLGLKEATLSMEMTLEQINKLKDAPGIKKNAIVYGRIPLMTSEYCPVGSVAGGFKKEQACNRACMRGEYRLKDRKGVEFPILCDRIDCRSIILNSNVLFVPDSIDGLRKAGVDMIRLIITDEKPEDVYRLAELFKDVAENGETALKKYGEFIDEVKGKGFTKGHYYREV